MKREAEGVSFELNQGKRLCGRITIKFDDNTLLGKYVYLYNETKGKYELLKTTDGEYLELDTEGKYLLTEQKLTKGRIKIVAVVIVGVILFILMGGYIAVKKWYWFW